VPMPADAPVISVTRSVTMETLKLIAQQVANGRTRA
jgi:hypothetical protein